LHELGIANEILDAALFEADRHAAKKVTSILRSSMPPFSRRTATPRKR